MGKSLAEYAAQHPQQGAGDATEQAENKSIAERREEWNAAEKLRESLLRQITAGQEPNIILYTALECIGLYSADKEWTEAAKTALDSIYADLAQQSFIIDNAEKERERLEQLQADHRREVQNSIDRQLRKLKKIERALQDARAAASDPEETT